MGVTYICGCFYHPIPHYVILSEILFLGPKSEEENRKLVRFYLFYINRINIVAKRHLMLNKGQKEGSNGNDEEEGAGTSRSGNDGNNKGKRKYKRKPKLSCIPHPATLAW